jgi:hypothetical protein
LNSGRTRSASVGVRPGGQEVPEQAVMHKHKLGVQLDRALYQLPLRRHSRDHLGHRFPAGHLQPVGP